ncbi:unnamed protein product, partial [Mesorhabditis spiculigera]
MRAISGRIALKCLQLLSTVLLIIVLSNLGTQWILLIGSLFVPPFGIFMILRSPDRQKHLLPYQTYVAVAAGRRWLRVDAALCACMCLAFLGFSLILMLGAGKTATPSQSQLLLFAGVCGLVSALAYGLNMIISLCHLRMATIDFSGAIINQAKIAQPGKTAKVCPLPNGETPLPLHIDTLDRFHQSPLPFPDDSLFNPRVQSISKERPVFIDDWPSTKRIPSYEKPLYDCRHFGINMVATDSTSEPFQVYDIPADSPSIDRKLIRPPRKSSMPGFHVDKAVGDDGIVRIDVSTSPIIPSTTHSTVSTLVSVNDYSSLERNRKIRVQSPRPSPTTELVADV